jgi:biotin carboxylase
MTAASSEPKTVCLIDAYGTSGTALASALRDAGCRVVNVHSKAVVPPLYVGTYRPELFSFEYQFNDLNLTSQLRALDIAAVLPGTEAGTREADQIAFNLGLPGNPPSTSALRRDKYAMGEAVRAAGLDAVRQSRAASVEAAVSVVREWGTYPVVVKPVESAANDGVVFCYSEDEVIANIEKQLGAQNCMGLINNAVLIQEYLQGVQYIVNTFSLNRRHHIVEIWRDDRIKIHGGGNIYDRETLIDPAGSVQDDLKRYALKVLDALDVVSGPTHGEYMMTSRGPVLIEVGARLQGGLNDAALKRALGSSLIGKAVRHCLEPERLDIDLVRPYVLHEHVMVVNLIAPRAGILVENNALERLSTLRSFHSLVGTRTVGAYLPKTIDLSTKPGHVYLVDKSSAQLERDYETIRAWEAEDVLLRISSNPNVMAVEK